MLIGGMFNLIKPLLGKEEDDTAKDPKLKSIRLAEAFKDSVETSTLQIDRAIMNPRDEIIEVKVKSTNRVKVAEITNQLCRSFIDEYNSRAAGEALRAHEVLVAQATRVQAEFATLRNASKDDVTPMGAPPAPSDATAGGTIQAKPLTQGMGTKISDLEMKVIELQRIYTDTAPEVIRAREELEQARSSLNRQEALDSATALLDLLKKKQRQALVAAALYRSNQSGISIMEEAVPPPPSKTGTLLHYMIPAVAGAIGGVILGAALVLLLSAVDTHIQSVSDVERFGGPHLVVKTTRLPGGTVLENLPPPGNIPPLLRVCSAMELANNKAGRQTMLVASPDSRGDDGETALQLACLLARNTKLRVLLIDADLQEGGLTNRLGLGSSLGLVESLNAANPFAQLAKPTPWKNLSVIPVGNLSARSTLGLLGAAWRQRLEETGSAYDIVILYAPGIVDAAEAPVLGREMDHAVILAVAGATLQNSLQRTVSVLGDFGLHILGTVLLRSSTGGRTA
jgi:Mrp family chromosome partitioning ATPase